MKKEFRFLTVFLSCILFALCFTTFANDVGKIYKAEKQINTLSFVVSNDLTSDIGGVGTFNYGFDMEYHELKYTFSSNVAAKKFYLSKIKKNNRPLGNSYLHNYRHQKLC